MDLAIPPPGDFAGYWALGRLLTSGATDYDGTAVLVLQQTVGWRESYPNLVWYAPWALPIFAVFGALPFAFGWPLWLGLQMALLFGCADRLWLHHGGRRSERWVAVLITVAFYPTLALAIWRQASALTLTGLVVFLVCHKRRRDLMAGAGLALAAMKPQLLYLVWLALAVWSWQTRRWRIVAGFVLAATAGTALAAALNPRFLGTYVHHLAVRPPDLLIVPSLGGALRVIFGAHRYWLQFVPALVGLAWLAHGFRRWRGTDFDAELPRLVLASFLFGVFFWTPDLVALSVCTIPAAVTLAASRNRRGQRAFGAAFFAITIVAAVAHEHLGDHWFYWLPVAYAVLLARARQRTQTMAANPNMRDSTPVA